MNRKWPNARIKDISTRVGDGLHGTPKYDDTGEYYFINGNNLADGKIIFKPETRRISKEEYLRIKKDLSDNTILVAINGTLGNIGFYNGENIALGKSACYINLKETVSKKYIRYVLEGQHFQKYANLFATGSTIKNLGLKEVRNYKFPLPPLPTQRKIAAILSAYDDLIENNLKRIKLLEEKAQLTYEEWFVRMKFPGHESTPINEETGLPEGWETKTLGDLGNVVTGKTPPTSKAEYYNGNIPFIKTPDMSGFPYVIKTNQYLSESGANTQKNKFLPKNSLVVSCIGSAGEFALVSTSSQFNQQINAIVFKDEFYTFFTYCYAKQLKPVLDALGSNGATMTNVNKGKFEKIKIIIPIPRLLESFHSQAKNHFESIYLLLNQIELLKEARDILLPRLMTGMIDVDALDLSAFEQGDQEEMLMAAEAEREGYKTI